MDEMNSTERLVRPVKCYFCNQPMFYLGEENHEPEVLVRVDGVNGRGGIIHGSPEFSFYTHTRCWNAKMSQRFDEAVRLRDLRYHGLDVILPNSTDCLMTLRVPRKHHPPVCGTLGEYMDL